MEINIHCEVYRLVERKWVPDSGWESRLDGSSRTLELAEMGEVAMLVCGQEAVVAEQVFTGVFWQSIDNWIEHVGEPQTSEVWWRCPHCGGLGIMLIPILNAGETFDLEQHASLLHLNYNQLAALKQQVSRGTFHSTECHAKFSYWDNIQERRRKLNAIKMLFPL